MELSGVALARNCRAVANMSTIQTHSCRFGSRVHPGHPAPVVPDTIEYRGPSPKRGPKQRYIIDRMRRFPTAFAVLSSGTSGRSNLFHEFILFGLIELNSLSRNKCLANIIHAHYTRPDTWPGGKR
jgi:hypothetical protein